MSETSTTYRAFLRDCPVTPRKARYVVDLVRGKPVSDALDILNFCPRRAAPMLTKLVMSALAAAQSTGHAALSSGPEEGVVRAAHVLPVCHRGFVWFGDGRSPPNTQQT